LTESGIGVWLDGKSLKFCPISVLAQDFGQNHSLHSAIVSRRFPNELERLCILP
jgi:hypothetical protein